MPNKRKRHTPEFEAKVSLDAIKGMKTASESRKNLKQIETCRKTRYDELV